MKITKSYLKKLIRESLEESFDSGLNSIGVHITPEDIKKAKEILKTKTPEEIQAITKEVEKSIDLDGAKEEYEKTGNAISAIGNNIEKNLNEVAGLAVGTAMAFATALLMSGWKKGKDEEWQDNHGDSFSARIGDKSFIIHNEKGMGHGELSGLDFYDFANAAEKELASKGIKDGVYSINVNGYQIEFSLERNHFNNNVSYGVDYDNININKPSVNESIELRNLVRESLESLDDSDEEIRVCGECGEELGPDIFSGDEGWSVCDECGAIESYKHITRGEKERLDNLKEEGETGRWGDRSHPRLNRKDIPTGEDKPKVRLKRKDIPTGEDKPKVRLKRKDIPTSEDLGEGIFNFGKEKKSKALSNRNYTEEEFFNYLKRKYRLTKSDYDKAMFRGKDFRTNILQNYTVGDNTTSLSVAASRAAEIIKKEI